MSFLRRLFGGGGSQGGTPAKPVRQSEHNGYRIEAMPYAEAGQYQVAGVISKEIGGALKQHRFVRADRFGTIDEAAEFALMKARQIIDQQGDRMFG
ncbi:MAG: HlyU family transcriptional regulator [Hyphomicrobiaceae bacterium]